MCREEILHGVDKIFMTVGSKLKDVKSLEQAFPFCGLLKIFSTFTCLLWCCLFANKCKKNPIGFFPRFFQTKKNALVNLKKIIMFLSLAVSFTSCGNNSKNDEKIHELLEEVRAYHSDMEKYTCVCLHADTKEVAIHFKEGEIVDETV